MTRLINFDENGGNSRSSQNNIHKHIVNIVALDLAFT